MAASSQNNRANYRLSEENQHENHFIPVAAAQPEYLWASFWWESGVSTLLQMVQVFCAANQRSISQ
jgi:hypothetical protein